MLRKVLILCKPNKGFKTSTDDSKKSKEDFSKEDVSKPQRGVEGSNKQGKGKNFERKLRDQQTFHKTFLIGQKNRFFP